MENYSLIKMLFSKEEYKHRLDKVKKSMQEKGIDLLISQDTYAFKICVDTPISVDIGRSNCTTSVSPTISAA